MPTPLKYVMFRSTINVPTERGIRKIPAFHPVIFGESLAHCEVADAILKNDTKMQAVSAGFVTFTNTGFANCNGRSESTKLRSHPQDGVIIDYGSSIFMTISARSSCKTYKPRVRQRNVR